MAYSKGKISIPNVTGNIMVTVTTVAKAVVNLFQKTPSEKATSTAVTPTDTVYIGARLNSSHKVVFAGSGQLLTRPIAAARGDAFNITTDKSNGGNYHYANAHFYDSSDNYLGSAETHYTSHPWVWDSDYMHGTLTVTETTTASDLTNTAYVRFCLAYTDIDNISITKA